jgi:hypothetical protein
VARLAILSLALACGCTPDGSGFAGDYATVAYLRQQGGCRGVQSVEPIDPDDAYFRLDDVEAPAGPLVGYFACTAPGNCDDIYDLARSFGAAEDDPDRWAGYITTAIPASPCVLGYRVRRLSAMPGGIAIDETVYRETEASLPAGECVAATAAARADAMPCVEESRLVAELP